ncbi:unnamed protein product [Blepharisma stoltei]|uniref:Guanylate kinase n=1 Tax=Blepharisma stoltei TaxID=1481888 RepID=A0AAU9JYW4_9CILI|nr:unnamed protein product [Blepharisma stoltei]
MEDPANNYDHKEKAIIDERIKELTHNHDEYIHNHPELQQILNDFVTEVLLHKPQDTILFAREFFSKFNPTPVLNKPLAIIGPSGVGKSTLIKALTEQFPGVFEFSISFTTRNPRGQEKNGVEYYFITKEEFMSKIDAGDFIEWAEVHDHFYGTSKSVIDDIYSRGKVCILDIDVQGAVKIFQSGLEFNRVFVMPKSMKSLEDRLRGRGTEDDNILRVRLRNAQTEIETARENPNIFKDFITNDVFEQAYKDFLHLIYRYYEHLRS